jgi:hypothetical protein
MGVDRSAEFPPSALGDAFRLELGVVEIDAHHAEWYPVQPDEHAGRPVAPVASGPSDETAVRTGELELEHVDRLEACRRRR